MKALSLFLLMFTLIVSSCGDPSNKLSKKPDDVKKNELTQEEKDKKVKVIEDENSLVNKVIILADPYEFSERLESDGILVDVRTADEFDAGHLPGAINIDYLSEDFSAKIDELDKINPINIYCQSGGRSGNAAIEMKKLGFKKIYDLDGGYSKWVELGL